MKTEYIEGIYAGWLAKIIGIRLGAPIEGWTYDKIKNIYGEMEGYPVDYRDFAADDDSNVPLFFLRALEDGRNGFDLKAQDVADALLNYAPFEHGFFWWGGYGTSTEHTAYLNIRNGIPAPRSGSIEQNGSAVAEQIGGQIFIDTWGLVAPGNTDLAAKYAREAASVTHGGNGIYGGIFVAVCISAAFEEKDIKKIIQKGLSYIPEDCEYARVVQAVMEYYENHPADWRECFRYIYENFGYDRYPGNCHIIPNIAVMILALLYGEGDFSKTLTICNMCGWDTDCNVGNVATIMGVRNGLNGIPYEKWRKPVHDFLVCSSVIGSLNIMDIPFGASYIAKLAYAIAGEEIPEPWNTIIMKKIDSCHFEYPGSTHSIRVRTDGLDVRARREREWEVTNTEETAYTGLRALKFTVKPMEPGENIYVYKKTYYEPADFHDSRYDPCFSPVIYPGQVLHGSAYLPEYSCEAAVSLYVLEAHSGTIYEGEKIELVKGQWKELSFQIPCLEGGLIKEAGLCFHVHGTHTQVFDFTGIIDDLYADGKPAYSIEFTKEKEEFWTGLHREISQFTRLKGLMYLKQGQLHISCADFGEAYTGKYDWDNYSAGFFLTPLTGQHHMVNVRVQGAIRSYAVGLLPEGKAAILKNENGYRILTETEFEWKQQEEYKIQVVVLGNRIEARINDKCILVAEDEDAPYLKGGIGVSVQNGSHTRYRRITIAEK
ncbi:ADP-ribosylglycohydrolase family protein [Anaerocolumna xylanovorans]|uniref:ADP-ribosylglycohydrolase n=1 Tax=Anaerocolumna xylanovorans DSM 12503 TaxID=1121345 RepID=A0A1M7Y298_9FIRM|nr:ADP-ribosylglycohydrolase family protein [Anaerocolumna xylanovorans]SHO46070.1 ADP-ribosylglycohydrolase [Anaerocolumna xylanovorans DSM 12503]